MNGIIIVNKDAGMTSHDVVAKLKRILNIKKIGHAGTLDPMATGVLVVLLNEATKLSDYLMADNKIYRFEVLIGKSSTTEDITGEIIAVDKDVDINDSKVDKVLLSMKGKLLQTPPMYSAIKQNGKKLYELARQGKVVERQAREVEIYDIKRVSEVTRINECFVFTVEANVSKGTYVRTICTEIGNRLGYHALMNTLCRTSSGALTLADSYTIEQIANNDYKIIDMVTSLSNYPQIALDDNLYKKVRNGVKLNKNELNTDEYLVVLTYLNQLVGIYIQDNQLYKAERVWN